MSDKPGFHPDEVLFSVTAMCNMRCGHCGVKKSGAILDAKAALRFIDSCADSRVRRIGFTGGEPFLAAGLLSRLIKRSVSRKLFFDRIMTNGSWFRSKHELVSVLKKIFRAGYDGNICVSIDAFHRQDLRKTALFIETAARIWGRNDAISIATIKGSREKESRERLTRLAKLLNASIKFYGPKHAAIKKSGVFIKIFYVDLAPIGKAAGLKDPWGTKWFRDDLCEGPGNVFFVLPDGTVKPCCGYANDSGLLTIGSIKTDTPQKLIMNARNNRFVSEIFTKGLHSVRRSMERSGVKFPGRTKNHCFFCHYLLTEFPQKFSASTS